ncbi:MAG: ROK family transcriptional regulator [Clostridia bacterium]|nr:ROK family transcriptional regulator [Clostridia bacterium]
MKKYINQQDMKQSNTADVFALIRRGRITRKQIAERLGMSWGAVSTITSELIENGYASECKAESDGAAGRTPSYLEVCCDRHFSIGLDVNDMGLRAVLVNLGGDVVEEFSAEADLTSKDALIGCICSLLDSIAGGLGERNLICIGIAMQGIVNAESGISVHIPGRDDWENVPLAQIIRDRYGVPAYLEHDPNCILFAARRGKVKDTLLVRADHGIGMAVMLGGRIIDKPGIFELGHTVVEPGGIPCGCGKRGCLDQYASIRGIKARSGKKFHVLISDADIGDDEAQSYLNDAARHLAYVISNVAYLLNVERIVLCGRLFEHRELFWGEFMSQYQIFGSFEIPKISFADATAAPHGAALIAMGIALRKIAIG